MILSDFHTHTAYCDGNNSPEEMILEAVSRGMRKLGFSGHSYTPFDEAPCMSPEGTEQYRQEIHRLREKYSGQIEILCGIEQDYYSSIPAEGYDYVIGSVHYVDINGECLHVDNTPEMFSRLIHECGDDPYTAAEKYYSLVSDVVKRTGANIIGHFDLFTKLNERYKYFDEDNPRYISAAMNALDSLLETGAVFEINTGAISRGYRSFAYPSMRLLKRIAEKGGRVILSSDAHDKNNLMYQFPEYEELALSLGLNVVEL